MDSEVLVNDRYLTAVATAMNFLSVFLGKCGVKNNEEVDYRPLFENFVQVQLRMIILLGMINYCDVLCVASKNRIY